MLELTGECYCKAVTFSVISHTPYPYMRCYCSFCRISSGSGGYAINIAAQADSLSVKGEEHTGFHHGMEHDKETDELKKSQGGRYFCRECGSPLWAADPRWSEWIFPYASVIQNPLPVSPETVHIMLDFKAHWVSLPEGESHRYFNRYPDESIVQWHRRHGLYSE